MWYFFDGKKRKIHFVDEPCMVNVAVSRAICQFVIVTDMENFSIVVEKEVTVKKIENKYTDSIFEI